ncbi:hypothetical protein BBP00_00004343 [Phytophthora kernoviae]|uniref:GST N-terminal domain-containing protein n=1 Tax=Phytophthora kernoviae TaxID=325452 RepID=A0A3F2RTT1_9STRA|nr:hypothetical protein BBP00_00004343 [Phytophthora kernoviae]
MPKALTVLAVCEYWDRKSVSKNELFHSDEFQAISRDCLIPVFKDGHFVFIEGITIITYLADKFKWTGLNPKDVPRWTSSCTGSKRLALLHL